MLFTVFFIIFMTVHTADAVWIDPQVQGGELYISMSEFVQMTAETLEVPIIQSDAEMSAMRYAFKAGWIETPERSTTVTREQAAEILMIASGNVIWPQDAAPFADADDISEKYQEAGYLMERLTNMDIGSCAQLLPEGLENMHIEYLGADAILESGTARRALTDIPQSLLERFAADRWTLYLTSEPLSTYYPEHFGGVGVTDYKEKAIYVFVDASYTYSAENTLLHEFGHFLHHTLGGRFEEEIQQAYEKEKETLAEITRRNYCTVGEREFFAEAFRTYIQGNSLGNFEIVEILIRKAI